MVLRKTYDMGNADHQNALARDTRKLGLVKSRYTVKVKSFLKHDFVHIVVDVSCNRGSSPFEMAEMLGFEKVGK